MQQNKNLFENKNPNIKNNEIVNNFKKEGIDRNTIYDNLKRLENNQSFSDKKCSVHLTLWTREKKAKPKRLVNN